MLLLLLLPNGKDDVRWTVNIRGWVPHSQYLAISFGPVHKSLATQFLIIVSPLYMDCSFSTFLLFFFFAWVEFNGGGPNGF